MFDYFRALDGLTDEERDIHATVRAFVDETIVPNVQGWWDADTLPRELMTQMGELGILGPTTPASYGGSEISSTAYGLICYELERGDSGVRSSASVQGSLVMYPIYAYGSEEQKRRYLPELAAGEIIGCFGLTESDGGSDPGAMRTRARRDGDDSSSTAPRCGSPTARSPTSRSSGPRTTTTSSRASSSSPTRRASAPRSRTARRACARASRARSCSRTCASRPRRASP